MFELNFRDERLLPFEGAGAISRWQIRLPKETNQFDTDTISDLILQIKYTAREGGKILADLAIKEAQNNIKNGTRLFSLKNEFPNEWHSFLNPVHAIDDQVLDIQLIENRFPFLLKGTNFNINNVILFADSTLAAMPLLSLTSPVNNTNNYKFNKVPGKYGPLFIGNSSAAWINEHIGSWKLVNPKANPIKLNKDNCNDILAMVNYGF